MVLWVLHQPQRREGRASHRCRSMITIDLYRGGRALVRGQYAEAHTYAVWFGLFLCLVVGFVAAVYIASRRTPQLLELKLATSKLPEELSAEGWIAIGTMLLAIATAALVIVGLTQLIAFRQQALRQYTLAVCERWDTDPVIDQCLRRLSDGWRTNDIRFNPRRYRIDAVTILNFLKSICRGIESGVYDRTLAKEFMADTIEDQIEDYLNGDLLEKMGVDVAEYVLLREIHQRWTE
jgi:hypothetical protein